MSESLSRSELHGLVWSVPMQHLAKRFGISDVAIAKRCRKLNIPVPGRGYWARKVAGQRVRVKPLPAARNREDNKPIVFIERPPEESRAEIRDGPVWEQEQFEARAENRITISDGLSRRPVIRATSAMLRERRDQSTAQRPIPHDGALRVSVSRAHVTRALHFLDAFVRACETRGFIVRGATRDQRESTVTVHDQTIEFELREPLRRIDLAQLARERGEKPREFMYPRYRFEGTGKFEFHIGGQYGVARRGWRDGKTQRIEDCLNDIMVALVAGAVALKEQAEQRARDEVERARLARLEYEEQEQAEHHEQRVQQLLADAKGWEEANALRAFASAVEADALARCPATPLPVDVSAWVAWVHWLVDEKDPLALANPIAFLSRDIPDPRPAWMREMMHR